MSNRRVSMQSAPASMIFDISRLLVSDSNASSSLKAQLLGFIRARDFKGICNLPLPNIEYRSEFLLVRQLKAFFNKNAEFSSELHCAKAATESFHVAETQCSITNKRLDWFYFQRNRLLRRDPDLELAISKAEVDIRRLLGDSRAFLNQIPDLVRVTGGATEDRPRKKSLPFLKISRKLKTSTLAKPLLSSYLTYVGYRKEPHITCTDTNRIVFVRKNWKTHRTIACEPTGLLPFQLAGDTFIKRKLLKWGVDLSSQTRNQELALRGSLDGSLCTIDLSSASDTLAYNTVAWLLPEDWFSLLKRLRCQNYKGSVGSGSYSKFASMGNGLTFVLETLIFTALVRATGAKEYSVYGDDIIVPPENTALLLKLLRFFGFTVNKDKSFFDGPFRESCGFDCIDGKVVTPFYVRKRPRTNSEMCHMINGLVSVASPYGDLSKYLARMCKRLPKVPICEDSALGVFISYETALAEGLVVQSTKKFGPWVPACKGYSPRSPSFTDSGIRSYLIWLLFRNRVRKEPTSLLKKLEIVDYTTWPTGRDRRVLTYTAARSWSSSCPLGAWEEILRSQGGLQARKLR